MPSRTLRLAVAAAAIVAVRAFVAGPSILPAGIVGTTGNVQQIAAPFSVLEGALERGAWSYIFQENSQVMLTGNLKVDVNSPGAVHVPADRRIGFVSAETNVDSYLLHQDRPDGSPYMILRGSITFDTPILGVILTNRKLNKSDNAIGGIATSYPTNIERPRGLELKIGHDRIRISDDMMTLHYKFRTFSSVDQVRILVQAASVPTPGTAALLGVASVMTVGRRRRA